MFYSEREIEILREAGKRLACVLDEVEKAIAPGVTTQELDTLAHDRIVAGGNTPAFLGYAPEGYTKGYPATLCVSVNDEVVHGIPSPKRVLKEGDIVGIDLGLRHRGLFVDSARTVPVGSVDSAAQALIETTRNALYAGIAAARAGGHVGDIGAAVESAVAGSGFSIVRELGGHGVGQHVHEDPFIPNFGKKGTGPKLKSGMVLAIEPMLNEGKPSVTLSPRDGYTFLTKDGKRSAHFEHTIVVTKGAPEILTKA